MLQTAQVKVCPDCYLLSKQSIIFWTILHVVFYYFDNISTLRSVVDESSGPVKSCTSKFISGSRIGLFFSVLTASAEMFSFWERRGSDADTGSSCSDRTGFSSWGVVGSSAVEGSDSAVVRLLRSVQRSRTEVTGSFWGRTNSSGSRTAVTSMQPRLPYLYTWAGGTPTVQIQDQLLIQHQMVFATGFISGMWQKMSIYPEDIYPVWEQAGLEERALVNIGSRKAPCLQQTHCRTERITLVHGYWRQIPPLDGKPG